MNKRARRFVAAAPFCLFDRVRGFELYVLGRPGSDLLSQVLRHSTIGAKAFDGRVRDGIGSDHLAKATRPAKDIKFFVEVIETGLLCRVACLTTGALFPQTLAGEVWAFMFPNPCKHGLGDEH